ncbi:hypothetical protein [Bacillus sp. UNCCL13]|uniref:hypothetical protein n=1 Tax=Bacillus sp. UNCCL13 TaxID=1502772 RepID=UPI001C3149F0|nr:hypothetical protein [Bacillus sp. UNCCL13]
MKEQKAQAPCLAPTRIRRITQEIPISEVIWLMTEVVSDFGNNPEGLGAGAGLLEKRRKLSILIYFKIS